ncbi:MAG: hypothetical protein COX02_01845 [Candidatus Vogelbacteria bacterium CG22_combo_CG10-13_8_21_14_all_37_9]|uniref:Methyltransferase domain-containing protein n=1 Tax=Candidatus Vogelbacteria bacterium CG22_combo_CG10-13_8_21_14_all_37_9 TaxID=1975046 RepID=A0A2H0BKG6_9BACT|nr:MAG: hypothetical protein BK005_02015 [bacterium CG10_37_50]PIP58167.1 MAG: hypothetical protein COX02_01845 [Candidatus Vogelbacteria bacterium CG22_combo_CG10-13_8_21_14_all_37_9]
MKQDPVIYDQLSADYSARRYAGPINTYTKYIFTTRRFIFGTFLKRLLKNLTQPTLFEIGCADGVLARFLREQFPGQIGHFVGVDISPAMVKIASTAGITETDFYLRDQIRDDTKYDVVLEIGVHTEDWESELDYWKQHLKIGGYVIKSVVGRESFYTRLKLARENYVKDYLSYKDYENIFRRQFEIVEVKSYGLFIPKIWIWPKIAKPLQVVLDKIFVWYPEFYHERIYLLKKL